MDPEDKEIFDEFFSRIMNKFDAIEGKIDSISASFDDMAQTTDNMIFKILSNAIYNNEEDRAVSIVSNLLESGMTCDEITDELLKYEEPWITRKIVLNDVISLSKRSNTNNIIDFKKRIE